MSTTRAVQAHTRVMWIVDDALIEQDIRRCVTLAATSGPTFDVEVITAPHLDCPPADADDPAAAMLARATARVRTLREPLIDRGPCGVLVSIGDPTGEHADAGGNGHGAPVDAGELWLAALEDLRRDATAGVVSMAQTPGFSRQAAAALAHNAPDGTCSAAHAVAAVFGVCLADDPADPYAYIAVVGLPAAAIPATTARAQHLIRRVATEVARTAPLYVVGLSAGTATLADSRCWQRLRTSLVLYGPAARDDVVTVSGTPLDSRLPRADVAMVPCPPFKPGVGTPGMVRVRVNVVKGQAEIAFHYDVGSDRPRATVQVLRPLVSASRITSGERRLYTRVREIVDEALRSRRAAGGDTGPLETLAADVEACWHEHGYAMLCTADRKLAGVPATRPTRYLLLLVLREREDGGYDLLLSNHSPLRDSTLGEWNTLLLPAFQYPSTLLGHLHDDVMRQAVERAEDLERGAHAQAFEEAVTRILRRGRADDAVWLDKVREVATFPTRKISPTTGFVTEFEYHFVTLLPLVEQPDDSTADQDARDAEKIIAWLDDLDTVRAPGRLSDGLRGLAIEAFQAGGGGVRFEPEVELLDEPDAAARARAQKAPPGAVWFPLSGKGTELWEACPSIRARNVDVMTHLGKVLQPHFDAGGLPSELLLGRYIRGRSGYETLTTYEFDVAREDGDADVPGTSTCDALAKVRFTEESDLRGQLAYPQAAFRRVYLVRWDVGAAGRDREAILVFDADVFDARGPRGLTEDDALGRLRPVQRYVLEAGLERARELDAEVVQPLREHGDPWGFARVRKAGVGIPVSITPPIVERLHTIDWGERGDREFIVCDGNHRVVQRAWIDGLPLAAVAVDAQPAQPYYALPFGDLEWGVTAENRLASTPSPESKYLARKVDEADLEPAARAELSQIPVGNRFRRYFRNLETGFGSLGGQGGRFA